MKLIKFDLPIDGVKVKNIEELRDHFTIEILEHYRSGLLGKWLRVRGMTEQLIALEQIESTDNRIIFKQLCKIMQIEIDEAVIACSIDYENHKNTINTRELSTIYESIVDSIDSAIYEAVRTNIITAPRSGIAQNRMAWTSKDELPIEKKKGHILISEKEGSFQANRRATCAPANGQIIEKCFETGSFLCNDGDLIGWFLCSADFNDYKGYSYALRSIMQQRRRCLDILSTTTDNSLLKKALTKKCHQLTTIIDSLSNDWGSVDELNNLSEEYKSLFTTNETPIK